MQTKSKILEETARFGLGGLKLLKEVKAEVKRGLRSRLSAADQDNGLVLQEEFRVFSKIVQQQQLKIDELEKRIIKLEKRK